MIDLSKLKPGDTVKFRCGGSAVVTESWGDDYNGHETYVMFDGYKSALSWHTTNGRVFQEYLKDSPLDIIAIESPEPRKVVEYVGFTYYDGFYMGLKHNPQRGDGYYDHIFRITKVEGQPAQIEEVL